MISGESGQNWSVRRGVTGEKQTRPGAVLFVVCAALFLVVVDVTVLHVAAPAIGAALTPSAAELLWVVDIYPLVVAPLLLVSGVAGDRFGRRRLLIWGLVVFGVVSVPAAFAPTPWVLILARALMGVGAAMIMPSTMSLLRVAYPDRSRRLRAVGIWSAVSAVGAAAGPLIGGVLVEAFWWGAIFLINVPLAAIVVGLAWWMVAESRSDANLKLDPVSVLLSVVSVLAVVFAIKHSVRYGLDPITIATAVAAGGGIVWFVRRQLNRQRHGIEPLLNVKLFARGSFTMAVLAVLLAMFGIVGLDLLFAQYLQNVLGLSPTHAALRLMPIAVATIAGSLIAPTLVRRLGTRITISVGLGAAAAALVPMLTLGTTEQLLLFSASLAVVGFSLDVAMVAANDTIIAAAPQDYVGQAAGVEETPYDLGGGLGIAILGSVLAAVYTATYPPIPGLTPTQQEAAASSIGAAEHLATTAVEYAAITTGAQTAFMTGLHTALTVSIVTIAAAAIAASLLITTTHHSPDPDH